MDREGFRNRMKQYKKAREENPGLKYWEWKAIPKYDEGTNSVLTDYEIPWWQRIINSGEKVQPVSQLDVTNYQEQLLQQRHQISKNIMREVESIGVYGEPYLIEDWLSFNPQTVFLLNEKDQQTIMERNGYKKVDISTEKDPYGLVRSAANFHNKTKNVPVYEYTIGSDSTVTRDLLSHLFSYNARDAYNARLLPHVGNVPIAVYINPETGKVYKREYDLNDYGPVDGNATGFIGNVSSVKQFGGRMLDVLGTPFVLRTGFYEVLQPHDLMNESGVSEQLKRTLINGLTNYYNINNKDLPNWLFNAQNFAEGGQVEPDPLEVLERSKPKFHGMPLAKGNINGVFSPIDVPLATLPKVWPVVNKWLPNYGQMLGALVGGDDGLTVNGKTKPLTTKLIDADVKEHYEDIVIPLRPLEDYIKQIYLQNPDNFVYNVYADDAIPDNRLADFNNATGEVRIKESILNSPIASQILAHEINGHRSDRSLPRSKAAKATIDKAFNVRKKPLSKESKLLAEKEAETTRLSYNFYKYMKDNGLLLIKKPMAKTKAYQDYVLNATDDQIDAMLGNSTVYSRDYKASGIDYDKIRWALAYAPEIAAGLIIPQHLLSNDEESKQWI